MKRHILSPMARNEYSQRSSSDETKDNLEKDRRKIKEDLDSLHRLFRESAKKGDRTIKRLASDQPVVAKSTHQTEPNTMSQRQRVKLF